MRFSRDNADSGRVDLEAGDATVPAIRLADFVRERVDLLKLDIEGGEYAVIEDLCRTRKIQHIDKIICEVHGRSPDKEAVGRVLTRLVDEGFTFSVGRARPAPDLAGRPESTPFSFTPDGKFLLQLYAWRLQPS